ncbi:hypothetical protein [Flavobacterium sp. W21_SRS_FM6]
MSANAVNIRPAMPDDGAPLLALMHQHAEFEQASEPSITIDK